MKESPLLPLYSDSKFTKKETFGMTIASDEKFTMDASTSFVMDLSAISKILVVGKDAKRWLEEFSVTPNTLFACSFAKNGGYICQVMADQYLIVSDPSGQDYREIFNGIPSKGLEVLILPYECAEILLGGPDIWRTIAGLVMFNPSLLSETVLTSVRIATVDVYAKLSKMSSQHIRIIMSAPDAHFLAISICECLGNKDDALVGFDPTIKL